MSKCMSKKSRSLNSKLPSADLSETSQQKPEDGREIIHFSHPGHRLERFDFPYLFMCMGCKEYGAGRRFMCQLCGFHLHEFCALAPPCLHDHPFHQMHHQLLFFIKPGTQKYINSAVLSCDDTCIYVCNIGGFLRCRCNICGKSIKGYSFHCSSCSFDMHPCCATMNRKMEFSVHQHPLLLAPAMEGAGNETSFICQICRRRRSGHVYQCMPCGFYLHAKCAKDMVNGLYVHGIVPPEKSNVIVTAAKVTMNALFGIIGGLIEGIGEGIGEAFVENIGRSRSRSFR